MLLVRFKKDKRKEDIMINNDMLQDVFCDIEHRNELKNKVEAYKAIIKIFEDNGLDLSPITDLHIADKEIDKIKHKRIRYYLKEIEKLL